MIEFIKEYQQVLSIVFLFWYIWCCYIYWTFGKNLTSLILSPLGGGALAFGLPVAGVIVIALAVGMLSILFEVVKIAGGF